MASSKAKHAPKVQPSVAEESEGSTSDSVEEVVPSGSMDDADKACVRLQLPRHLAAYYEKKKVKCKSSPLKCTKDLMEKVTCNYIIVKQIVSHLPWREKALCRHVSQMWNSVVLTAKKEQLWPEDFVLYFQWSQKGTTCYKKSGKYLNEPLAVLAFGNGNSFHVGIKCKRYFHSPCPIPCNKKHCLLDVAQNYVCSPKNCMLTVKASYLCYMPLFDSATSNQTITQKMFQKYYMFSQSHPFLGGVYIPAIPEVKFEVINIKSKSNLEAEFNRVVDSITRDRIVKGLIVYVTDNFTLDHISDIGFLNYFKTVQPDIPYALGGCLIEDVASNQEDIDQIINVASGLNSDFVSENLLSIGVFTVPKISAAVGEKYNFEMYSLVIQSYEWNKLKIVATINEFSKKVPHFEHSIALKLSCVGRDKKHDIEQDYFRTAFPNTRLIGCYGNGELGINHPAREDLPTDLPPFKKIRMELNPNYGLMFSYATVFVYFGWGKTVPPPTLAETT